MVSHNICRGCSEGIKVGILMLSVLLLGQGANAITINVDDSGGMDYLRIQDAIDNAGDGDTILVANGTYFGQISITKNNLTIIGYERNSTIIHGNWSAHRVVDVEASNVYFSGFTIGNSEWEGIGLYLNNTTNFTFINNTLKDNYHSMQMSNSTHNLIDSTNIVSDSYYGNVFSITSSSNNILKGNTGESRLDLTNSSNNEFYNNSISNIEIHPDSNGNKFAGNKFGYLSFSTDSDHPYSNENIFRNNEGYRLEISNSNKNIIEGNNISSMYFYSSNNNIINNNTNLMQFYSGGISLYNSSHNAIYGNNITSDYENGISLTSNSKNNTISNNLIQTGGYSIDILWSTSNKIFLNTFNSAKTAQDYNGFNSWDNAGKGNYWGDYSGQDNDSDGIGDTPYLINNTNADAKDNYPLMAPPCNCTLLPIPTPIVDITVPSSGNVTRSISPSWVRPNSYLNITLIPSPSEFFASPGYQVVESIPLEFTFADSTSILVNFEEGNVYRFTQLGSSPFTYTIKAPSAKGNYTINGTFKDEERNYGNVSGMTIIRVEDIDYDANDDGRIDRNEAVQAVVDFFNGIITRLDAIEIVLIYFGG
jgi:parallel beta-helix repeat protein